MLSQTRPVCNICRPSGQAFWRSRRPGSSLVASLSYRPPGVTRRPLSGFFFPDSVTDSKFASLTLRPGLIFPFPLWACLIRLPGSAVFFCLQAGLRHHTTVGGSVYPCKATPSAAGTHLLVTS